MKNPIKFLKNAFEREQDFQTRLKNAIDNAITEIVDKVKENDLKTLHAREEEISIEYEFKIKEHKHEHESEMAEKDAKCMQYVRMINELQEKIENCQRAYQMYCHDALESKRNAIRITDQIDKVFQENGTLWKGFARIQDDIIHQVENMGKKDDEIRSLLGMSKQNKLLLKKKEENE